MAKKWVYLFTEGDATMRNLLGGKGANLAEMTNIGLPVPQGFTITTEACTQYYEDGREINDEIQGQINEYIGKMEEITGKKFGDKENPLLVSVRSGARASMPGMMDTILNLGLNETVVEVLAEKSGNPRWAWDCYRRFIQMYSDVVMEVGKKYFEALIDEMKEKKGVKLDVELDADDLKELANQFKAEYKNKIGVDFPDDPKEQLMGAIKAVFRSWDNPRANVYRRDNDIPYSWGTAVNVQMMAFGNMGDDCGTGVAFTRDPATGANGLFGEFLTNAQGEDVVAGVRTPMHISEMEQKFPEAFVQFKQVCETLEKHYRDMQDMEFTVEHGKLYMLQTRNGKRTAQAALKIACDLVDEGMRTEEEAVAMIDPRNLDTLLHPQFDAAALKAATPMGKGLGASPGAACGKIVFTASLNGQEATSEVVYELIEPRVYFKIGDIYYNENSEAVGVVVWVDEEDLQRAKIVSLEEGSVQYAGSGNGLGLDFDTPDKDNGASNTEKMIEKNNTLSSPLSGIYSAFTWANSYAYKGERDWFLPAINELVSLAENLEVVNEAIEKAGGAKVVSPYGSSSTMKYNLFSSTTEVEEGATTKTIYCYNFSDNVILPNKARNAGSEYFGWIKARAFKIVRK